MPIGTKHLESTANRNELRFVNLKRGSIQVSACFHQSQTLEETYIYTYTYTYTLIQPFNTTDGNTKGTHISPYMNLRTFYIVMADLWGPFTKRDKCIIRTTENKAHKSNMPFVPLKICHCQNSSPSPGICGMLPNVLNVKNTWYTFWWQFSIQILVKCQEIVPRTLLIFCQLRPTSEDIIYLFMYLSIYLFVCFVYFVFWEGSVTQDFSIQSLLPKNVSN